MVKTEMVEQATYKFRALRAEEVDASYDVYQRVRDWLRANEIRIWLSPLPKEKFVARQTRGELFGAFCDEKLATIFALVHEMPDYWAPEIGLKPQWWLTTLATAPEFRGKQIGRRAIVWTMNHLQAVGVEELYLDCACGFLPNFYASCGFRAVAVKAVSFPSGNTYELTLMKRPVRPRQDSSVTV
ncbi:MAG: GNAT family N-acetyltransferase [Nibricoccus sp.]